MNIQTVNLKEAFPTLPETVSNVSFTAYLQDNQGTFGNGAALPAIIICPGGGYVNCSPREGEPIALRFAAEGFRTFVLNYPVAPDRYPKALLYLSAAVAWVRRNAQELCVLPDQIAVCGFSAAGHLCASLGALWNEDFIAQQLSLMTGENRPDAAILAYPVITSGQFAHKGSFNNLLGEDADPELSEKLSIEKSAGADFPPTFLWTTYTDNVVPAENSLLLANRLRECGISVEFHLFHKGPHGLSLCDRTTGTSSALINPHCARWVPMCTEWLREIWSE